MDQVRRRQFLIAASAPVAARLARAQQPPRVTLGFLSVGSRTSMSARTEAFQKGLRELGYMEGKNIFVEYRYADANPDRLPELAAELVRLNVRVIVTEGTTSTRFAKVATSTIPIVMAQDPDPVGTGFVASLARPGGNITGLSNIRSALSAKRLEILKETVPGLERLIVLGTLTTPGAPQELRETELAAQKHKVQIQYFDLKSLQDIDNGFQAATSGRANAIVALGSPFLLNYRQKVAELATRSRLPAIYHSTDFVEDGGLMSYSVKITDLFHGAATYVDKILKGAKPADLPIEQPTKIVLVINLKAAKQIGLTIPPSLLLRADRVIE